MPEQGIDTVLRTTRAVRRRLDLERPVARSLVQECIEIALQAPNGSNMNSWRFVAIDDRDIIARMADIYRGAMDDYVQSLGTAVGSNYAGAAVPGFERIDASVTHLRDNLHRVPVLVLPLLAGRLEGAGVFQQASQWGSVIQASWSFMLALRARGLGSSWTTVHLCREREMAGLLGIPAHYTQVALLPVAYTIGESFKPAWRRAVTEVLDWNGFEARAR
jgi:nitroreductase